MEFTIDSCVRGYHVSKGFWTLEVGEELACQRNPNDVYAVAVKTFLKCLANSREMTLIPLDGVSGVPLQLSLKGGDGQIYIRPIQSDLQLLPKESSGADVSSELSERSCCVL